MKNSGNPWQLRGTTARLTIDSLAAAINVQRPDLGLNSIATRIDQHEVHFETARILAVSAGHCEPDAIEAIDYYARGDDLIVSCRLTKMPDIAWQIYWRVVRDESSRTSGVEAIVSAQTELLDSDPASTISSLLPAGDALAMTAGREQDFQPIALAGGESTFDRGCVLIRLENDAISYLEMVHPSDDCGVTIQATDGQLATSYPVLTERLEKGVIRRGRLRAMFVSRENDCAVALELYQRFASSPVPLTA